MKCENCQAEISTGGTVCPECGGPLPQMIEGFDNSVKIQRILRAVYMASGDKILSNTLRLTALLNDCLADFDKERRLLVNMLGAGILKSMMEESDRNIAVMSAKSSMQNDCFIIEGAAEFVLACFTYFLGWTYDSPMRVGRPAENAGGAAPETAGQVGSGQDGAGQGGEKGTGRQDGAAKAAGKQDVAADPGEKVFRPFEAAKYRLSKNVIVPEGFTRIESFCFDKFGFMRTIDLPETLVSIGEYAFSECKNLVSAELPRSVRVIQHGAFSQCAKLTSISIPRGVLEIAENTFLCCQSLEFAKVPATVTSIGASAFSGCDKLQKIFLHDSVKYIDNEAFLQCPELVISCYENSYVHKYCLSHDIKFEIVAKEINTAVNGG
ncbi:MAG: leucine-rich repeat domain-containing protein [Oscillospiraceae bacterium]|nr:leucine-rich repeat domain-containing protein [Oscillospiraceae bacterium]